MKSPTRIGNWLLIIALGIMISGAVIGFTAPFLRDAPWTDDITAIAGNPAAHSLANSLIILAGLITAFAFALVSDGFDKLSKPWAQAGMSAFLLASAFQTMDRIISIKVKTWAVQEGFDLTEPLFKSLILLQDGFSAIFYYLGFTCVAFFGIAFWKMPKTKSLGLLFGLGGLIGIILTVFDGVIPGFVYLGTGSIGIGFLLNKGSD